MGTGKRIILYTGTVCPICALIEEYLAARRVEYTKIDVDEDPEGKKAFLELGYDNLPVLDIEGTTILGYDTEAIDNALKGEEKTQGSA